MPVQLTCPSCRATLSLDEAHLGKKICCAGCKHVFVATAPKPEEEPLVGEIIEDPDPATAIQTGSTAPVPPPSSGSKPPPLRRGNPDEKSRPTPRPGSKPLIASPTLQLVVTVLGLGIVSLGILGCVVGTGWIMHLRTSPEQVVARNKNLIGPGNNPIPKNPPVVEKDKGNKDKGDPPDAIGKPEEKVKDKRDDERPEIKVVEEKKFDDPFKDVKFKDPEPKPVVVEVPVVAQFPPHDPSALALKSCNLEAEKVTRQLPGTLDDVAVGGGGRFVLFSLPQLRKIGMLDVNEGKIVHYFPTAGDNVKFSAGLTKLVVLFPDTRLIQRWDLISKEKELTLPLPEIGPPKLVLLGSASQGPVLVGGGAARFRGGSRKFLNLATFKEIDFGKNVGFGRRGLHPIYTRV